MPGMTAATILMERRMVMIVKLMDEHHWECKITFIIYPNNIDAALNPDLALFS